VWYFEQAEPGSAAHWIDVALRICGPLDVARLIQSVHAAVERHEILRTVFRLSGGVLYQVIVKTHTPDLRILDSSAPVGLDVEARPVDLTTTPAVHAELTRSGTNEHTLQISIHRIIGDGLSTRLLLSEIGALYANSLGSGFYPLLDSTIQYADYAAWERSWLTPERSSQQVDFFHRELKTADAAFLLPADRPRSAKRLRRGARLHFEFSLEVSETAHAIATRERASLYTVLLAAFASALGRYTRRSSVVIASPVSRRTQGVTEQMMGPFMSILPLRIDVPNGSTLPELVRHVKAVLLAALAHQDAPLHRVIAKLKADIGSEASGIAEVALVMEAAAPAEIVLGDVSLARIELPSISARRDLTVSFAPPDNGEKISGTVVYDRDLFDVVTIQTIVANFELALRATERTLTVSETR
jgi:hypothetical protein